MAPSGVISRENSMGATSWRSTAGPAGSESKHLVARSGSSLRVEQDPDVESGRWSFMEHIYGGGVPKSGDLKSGGVPKSGELGSERNIGRSGNIGKFGSKRSTTSQSPLDMLAAGLDITCLPFYDVSVRKLSYEVNVGSETKRIMNNVSCDAFHGQILAVVGPSGSGKTTLLDALAGRISRKSLQGDILVNGEVTDESFNRISGYVLQDDALFPHLTVKETLMYSARLRIPGELSLAEKRNRVENMIITLGLKQCADTKVGSDKIRGVSGGERRRVSIGADLIHDPAVLFLDEPTSGLDSTSALNVMQKLARMASTGRRTVILTIHQPSYRILETIERVLVMGGGNVIFHGRHVDLKNHFNSLGRTMPPCVNVIEYALDTIEDYQRSAGGLEPLISSLELRNKDSQMETEILENKDDQQFKFEESQVKYATSMWSEIVVLADRNFKNVCRTPELFLSRMGMMVTMGLTLGTLFFRAKLSEVEGIQQRQSFIAFTLALIMFTSTESMGPFLEERHIFIREKSRGAYRTGTWVFSNAVVPLPFMFFMALVYSTVSYWLVGFVAQGFAFIYFAFVVFLTLCAANSFVLFCSGLVPSFTIGLSVVCGSIAYFFLFCGFFIPREAIPKYWIWMHYISLFKYPMECMLKNEFGRLDNVNWMAHTQPPGWLTSDQVLRNASAGKVHPWVNMTAMVGMFVGYRVLFWFTLRFLSTPTRK